MRLLMLIVALSFGITGCTSFLNLTRSEPIQTNPGKRTFGAKIDDSIIETKVTVNIDKASSELEQKSRIIVVSYNGIVLLTGQTPSNEARQLAGQVASSVRGVRSVKNQIQVSPMIAFLVRSSDTYLTTKVKSAMLWRRNVPGKRIKVVTENGVVYLMGLVTRQEADNAAKLASGVSGVQKVVKLFEYIN